MNIKDQEKLHRFFIEGHLIEVSDGGYLDVFIQSIRKDSVSGHYNYDSDVYPMRPLDTLSCNSVKVYQQIPNWQELLITPTEINPA